MVGLKLDLEMVSSSCDFLGASKFLFSAFTHDLKRPLINLTSFRDPSLNEVLRFRPQLGRFFTLKSLNWMIMDVGLRA